jgi:hypothetical protein
MLAGSMQPDAPLPPVDSNDPSPRGTHNGPGTGIAASGIMPQRSRSVPAVTRTFPQGGGSTSAPTSGGIAPLLVARVRATSDFPRDPAVLDLERRASCNSELPENFTGTYVFRESKTSKLP